MNVREILKEYQYLGNREFSRNMQHCSGENTFYFSFSISRSKKQVFSTQVLNRDEEDTLYHTDFIAAIKYKMMSDTLNG